jgi:hypothetical protein
MNSNPFMQVQTLERYFEKKMSVFVMYVYLLDMWEIKF